LAYKRTKRIDEAVKHFKKAAEIDIRSPIIEIKKFKERSKNRSNIIIFLLILIGIITLSTVLKR